VAGDEFVQFDGGCCCINQQVKCTITYKANVAGDEFIQFDSVSTDKQW
jgi:hypothetical protein